jgi:hypothetical protein
LFEKLLKKVHTSGGTSLAAGLDAAIHLAKAKSKKKPGKAKKEATSSQMKLRRVMFLTDMESSPDDEDAVVRSIRAAATGANIAKNVHCSVIGIGVDLSVGTVQSLSSIPGCRYMSVASTQEFTKSIADEFAHDVTPIALNICVELAPDGEWTFEKGVGSAEVNGVSRGDTKFKISSEFPMPTISDDGNMKGGMLLFKLARRANAASASEGAAAVTVLSSWKTIDGAKHATSQNIEFAHNVETAAVGSSGNNGGDVVAPAIVAPVVPDPEPSLWSRIVSAFSFGSSEPAAAEPEPAAMTAAEVPTSAGTLAIRKGVALMRFVDIQNDYCLDDMHDSESTTSQQHQVWVDRIDRFKAWFESELALLGDASLTAENTATVQTLAQIADLEREEIKGMEEAAERAKLKTKAFEKLRAAMTVQADLVPHSFLCPISKDIMEDAVIAADGHSYDRVQIERWLSSRRTSPKTGAALDSKSLIPNHSLQQAIQDFATSFDDPNRNVAAAAPTIPIAEWTNVNLASTSGGGSRRQVGGNRRRSAPAKVQRPTKATRATKVSVKNNKSAVLKAATLKSNDRKRPSPSPSANGSSSSVPPRNLRQRQGPK